MRAATLLFVSALVALSASCNATNFDPGSRITGVRVLATRADTPYAKPGATVNMEVLAFDGRSVRPRPMNVAWLPLPCIDPPDDAYYACFAAFPRLFTPGVDLSPVLVQGTKLSFQMPADVVAKHGGNRGNGDPYGLAVTFALACAGHVEYVPPPANAAPSAIPFGCFDEKHNQLGPDDFVLSYSLVYAFTDRTNANPVIDHITYADAPVDLAKGISMPHCDPNANANACAPAPLEIAVPDGTQEPDPGAKQPNGTVPGEEVWVDYYYTDGRVRADALTLFDPTAGKLPADNDEYRPPNYAGDQLLWAVVRDNRGGAAWVTIPVHVQ